MKHRQTSIVRSGAMAWALVLSLGGCADLSKVPASEDASRVVQNSPPAELASLGPLQLQRPLTRESLRTLSQQAEQWFQAREDGQARTAFTQLTELDPGNPQPWFRLGNLHQRAGELAAASDAYDHVLERVTLRADDALRTKALLNKATLNVWRAQQSLAELDRQPGDPKLAGQRRRIDDEVAALEGRVARRSNEASAAAKAETVPVGTRRSRSRDEPKRTSDGRGRKERNAVRAEADTDANVIRPTAVSAQLEKADDSTTRPRERRAAASWRPPADLQIIQGGRSSEPATARVPGDQ